MTYLQIHNLLLAAISIALLACSQSPKTASIEGDVFLVMKSGDVKPGAGNTVVLVRSSDSLTNDLGTICAGFRASAASLVAAMPEVIEESDSVLGDTGIAAMRLYVTGLPEPSVSLAKLKWGGRAQKTVALGAGFDSLDALIDRTEDGIRTRLLKAGVSQSSTGMKAHYRLEQVPPGEYELWSETKIGDNPFTWLAPVTVKAGDSLHVDLDNSKEHAATLYCGSGS